MTIYTIHREFRNNSSKLLESEGELSPKHLLGGPGHIDAVGLFAPVDDQIAARQSHSAAPIRAVGQHPSYYHSAGASTNIALYSLREKERRRDSMPPSIRSSAAFLERFRKIGSYRATVTASEGGR